MIENNNYAMLKDNFTKLLQIFRSRPTVKDVRLMRMMMVF